MKIIQLFKDGKEIIATDGIMYIDGRFNSHSIQRAVIDRNARFAKNFPHKIADSFAVYRSDLKSSLGTLINL